MRVLKIALIFTFFFQQAFAEGGIDPYASQAVGAPAEPEVNVASPAPVTPATSDAATTTVTSTGAAAQETIPNLIVTPEVVVATPGVAGKVNADITACNKSAKTAHTFCLSSNPRIQQASGLIGVLLSGAGALKSTSASCQKYNQALKIAEIALTAYNSMCSVAQMNCESTCGSTKTSMEAQIASVKGNPQTGAADAEAIRKSLETVVKQNQTCQAYKINIAAAGVGLMNVLKQSSLSSTCKNSTTVADCSKDPSNPSCVNTTNVDCSKAENQSQTQCICQRTPGIAGCPGATGQSAFAAPSSNSNSLSGVSADQIKAPNLNATDSSLPTAAGGGSAGGAGLAGGGNGGGGGGGLGSGGQNGKVGTADGKKEKGMNTNILSGYEGGGGGGGGSRGGYNASNSAYNAYLPGGAKDPTRGLASQTFGNGQVTGAGSKSNWEKVSERYKDSKPTLIGP